jgi:hypothetical protein
MATETRTSEQGNRFSVALVRNFLLNALGHDAVVDEVNELFFDHVVGHRHHASVIATNLKPMLEEVLSVATAEDWDWVTRALTAEACEALGVEHPLDHAPKKARALGNLDAGELREKLAEIYTQRPVSLSQALRVLWIVRRLSQQTGISRRQIMADAKADAVAMRAAEDDTATGAHQRSAPTDTDTLDVTVSLPQAFVRPLGRDEVLTLMQKGEESKVADTRRRAAIILASNVGVTTSQLAAMHAIDRLEVMKVIAEFDERGVASVGDFQQ